MKLTNLLARAALAITAASALTTGVSVHAATVDVGNYIFSFNDYYFGEPTGVTFSQSGDVFTFANLSYAAATQGTYTGEGRAFFYDQLPNAITIAAKDGHQIDSVVTSGQGKFSGSFGSTGGSTYIYSAARSDWNTNNGPLPVVLASTGAMELSNASWGMPVAGAFGSAAGSGNYVTSAPFSFSSGTTSAVGTLMIWGDTRAQQRGSNASLSLDAISFSVAVTAVPEPETYALMLAGLGLIGAVARRRKSNLA